MAQYVEGPYIVEDQPDGTRKVVGYVNQQGGQQSNTLITKRASPDYQYAGPKAQTDLTNAQFQQPNTIFNQKDKLRWTIVRCLE